ncbi:MAG TPA: hypothetical protein VK550_09385 [Polyangiaceae bacterium]|nr:hypothetical protein [Polyangiaceae bacterium]
MRLRLTPLMLFLAGASACLDFPPRILPSDAGVAADGETPPEDAGPSACVECIKTPVDPGPGCGTAWDECKDIPKCVGLVQCTDELGCFRINDLPQFLNCVDPCVQKWMLAGTGDPVYPIVTQIVLCTTGTGACVPICSGM